MEAREVTLWECSKCLKVSEDRDIMERCCTCYGCGKPNEYHCKDCREAREQDRLANAEVVATSVDDHPVFLNDTVYLCMDSLLDALDGEEPPQRLWAAVLEPLKVPDPSDFLSDLIDDEDTFDRLVGFENFEHAWYEFFKQNDIKYWVPRGAVELDK